MDQTPLHQRVRAAIGNRTNRHIAEITGTGAESVRRYLEGAAPSAEFLTGLSRALGVSGEWLLTGRGPMRSADVMPSALREAGAPNLLTALAGSVETLIERVERLEVFVTTMETRLRARGASHDTASVAARARVIAGAITQRPCADAAADAPPRRA